MMRLPGKIALVTGSRKAWAKILDMMTGQLPLGHMIDPVEDVGGAAARVLAGEEIGFVTGQVIYDDGGQHIAGPVLNPAKRPPATLTADRPARGRISAHAPDFLAALRISGLSIVHCIPSACARLADEKRMRKSGDNHSFAGLLIDLSHSSLISMIKIEMGERR